MVTSNSVKAVPNIKIKKIDNNFKISDLKSNELPVYDIKYKQKKSFEKISSKSNKYIFKCFDIALQFAKDKKIHGFINCPVSKESLFKNIHLGIAVLLLNKLGKKDNEEKLDYNKK